MITHNFVEIARKRRLTFCVLMPMLTHFLLALFAKEVLGVRIDADPLRNTWDWFWQTLPSDLLASSSLESIWFLHAQPPGFNIVGSILINIFPVHHLQALHYFNIVLGTAICGMMWILILEFTHGVRTATVLSLLFALNPALLLFEAYLLYTTMVTFLVIALPFSLAMHKLMDNKMIAAQNSAKTQRSADIFLYLFIILLNILIMTRSLYHLVLVTPAILLIYIIKIPKGRRILTTSIAVSLISIGWYGKNLAYFDFFGASSWMGMGLWRVAKEGYGGNALSELADLHVVSPMVVTVRQFSPPSTYLEYGYSKESPIKSLSRDDLHNINIPDISKEYSRNAIRLIRYDKRHYIANVLDAYILFSGPSTSFKHLSINRNRITPMLWPYERLLFANVRSVTGENRINLFTILLPLSIFVYVAEVIGVNLRNPRRFTEYIRVNATTFMTFILITYTILVGNTFEYGENIRFKFPIEFLAWAFIIRSIYYSGHFLMRTEKPEFAHTTHVL